MLTALFLIVFVAVVASAFAAGICWERNSPWMIGFGLFSMMFGVLVFEHILNDGVFIFM